MVSPFSSLELRRWLVAALLTILVVSFQVVHAARATDGSAVASGAEHRLGRNAGAAAPVLPVEIGGTVVAAQDGLLGVHEAGAEAPVAFPLDGAALLVRDGGAAEVDDLRAGDRVRMTIDGQTGRVLLLRATPAPGGWQARLDTAGPMAADALVASLGLLAWRRWASARPRPRTRLQRVIAPAVPTGVAQVRFGATHRVGPRSERRRLVA